eukprot:501889-Rhodomonas_salina.1
MTCPHSWVQGVRFVIASCGTGCARRGTEVGRGVQRRDRPLQPTAAHAGHASARGGAQGQNRRVFGEREKGGRSRGGGYGGRSVTCVWGAGARGRRGIRCESPSFQYSLCQTRAVA